MPEKCNKCDGEIVYRIDSDNIECVWVLKQCKNCFEYKYNEAVELEVDLQDKIQSEIEALFKAAKEASK